MKFFFWLFRLFFGQKEPLMGDYQVVNPGFRTIDGTVINNLANFTTFAYYNGLTALAGGGRPSATALKTGLNQVATVATGADSVLLPPAVQGTVVMAANAGASAMQVFAQGSDTINGTAGSTGISQSNGVSAVYFCPVTAKWFAVTSA